MSTTICFYFYPLQIKTFAKHFYSFRVVVWLVHGDNDERPLDEALSKLHANTAQVEAIENERAYAHLLCLACTKFVLCACISFGVAIDWIFIFVLLASLLSRVRRINTLFLYCGRISHFISFDDLRNGTSFFMSSSTFRFFFLCEKFIHTADLCVPSSSVERISVLFFLLCSLL